MGAEDLPKGTLIDGRYDIRVRLGRGGMGTVYRAFDNKVGGMVALKVLREGRTAGGISAEDRQKRFGREILAINQVDHPNVVRIENFGFYKGAPYMVMQLLTGKDLGTVLRENGGPFSVEHAVDIVVSICVVIRACHEAQVVHRDLKPENVMIVKRDVGLGWEAKIVDFGIAKLDAIDDLTQEGRIAGTPAYLAPEQIAGKPGPSSDQYAIAVLLYLCLTGAHPFAGFSGLPLIRAIEKGVFKDPREYRPELPTDLAAIVCKAMHLEPGQRYGSVFELGRALRPFGSVLGQQLWKSYYDTPPIRGERIDPKASVAGIALARQIAERGAGPLGAPTLQAHYESTTAVGESTVHDAGVPLPIRDTVVESKAVTQHVQPSSATALDLARPTMPPPEPSPAARTRDRFQNGQELQRGTSDASKVDRAPTLGHRDESSDSGPAPSKRRGSLVAVTLLIAAALGGGVAWFVERGTPHLRAPVVDIGAVRPASVPAVPEQAPSQPAPEREGPALAPAPVTAKTAAESGRSPAPKPADLSDEEDQVKTPGTHHHHRRSDTEARSELSGDDRGVTDLLAAADAAFARGDYKGAIAIGRRAIGKKGGDDAYLIVGDASFKTDDFATARTMYQDVLKRNPSSDLARRRLEMVDAKEKQASNRHP